ncbi:sulfite exporter TauE/SafE family protein [Pedobacter immunditicola]|uniref:sulfite exporter TauE/SafE family protein n=1 Tax=Pedobacter immunditicola TaxID=3133440 RepID=UPI0030989021
MAQIKYQNTLEEKVLEKESYRVLLVGESVEIADALAILEQRNKDIDTEVLKEDGTFKSNDLPYSPELIAAHDLIILKDTASGLTPKIKHIASEYDVLISLIPEKKVKTVVAKGQSARDEKYWKKFAARCLFALAFFLIGHAISTYYPLDSLFTDFWTYTSQIELDALFGWMVLAGFVAQLVDGALGMGYGVISTTVLLSTGLNPAAISGSIHTAEMFSSGASGFSHYKFGNINKKLFKTLLLPGVLGAVIGAVLLVYLGEEYGAYLRPVLSVYTLLLGARILYSAFKKRNENRKVKNAGWLAGAGGFLDSFGGGGWGPLVTSTLIAKGKTPRYIIGTVSLTEFFVTFGSALTFFILLGTSHMQTIAGLIVGGLVAAPIAARLAGRLNTKTILISVGVLVIISSIRTIYKTIF